MLVSPLLKNSIFHSHDCILALDKLMQGSHNSEGNRAAFMVATVYVDKDEYY